VRSRRPVQDTEERDRLSECQQHRNPSQVCSLCVPSAMRQTTTSSPGRCDDAVRPWRNPRGRTDGRLLFALPECITGDCLTFVPSHMTRHQAKPPAARSTLLSNWGVGKIFDAKKGGGDGMGCSMRPPLERNWNRARGPGAAYLFAALWVVVASSRLLLKASLGLLSLLSCSFTDRIRFRRVVVFCRVFFISYHA